MAGASAVYGFDQAIRTLENIAKFPTPNALIRIRNLAVADVKKHFDDAGPGWVPNALMTVLAKKSSKPLTDNGYLKKSLSGRVEGQQVVVFTRLIYAAIQNYGGTINFPERVRTKGMKPWVFKLPFAGGAYYKFKTAVKTTRKTIFAMRIRAHSVTIPAREFMYLSAEFYTSAWAVVIETIYSQS
jgi:phage gpG-like protein